MSTILYWAVPQTTVIGPNCAIPEVAIACYFRSECLSTQTITRGLQQRSVLRVVTERDLELVAADKPKCWRYHVSVVGWISDSSSSFNPVIPPVTCVIHPVLGIIIWEPSDEGPTFFVWCHFTICLMQNHHNKKMWFIKCLSNEPTMVGKNLEILMQCNELSL